MIIEDAVDFLRAVPPLSFLEPSRLAGLARKAALDFFPCATSVLGPDGAGCGFVLAVKKGQIEADGERYGEGSLLGWSAVAQARVVEDCVCYLLPREAINQAVSGRPGLADFLDATLTQASLELGLEGIVRDMPAWLSRRPLAQVRAGDALRQGAPVAHDTAIRDVAAIMSATFRDAVVVTGREGQPAGVVTDADFRARAVGRGLSPDTPVEAIMTSPVVSIDSRDSCFDALMAMTRHHLRHVVVMAGRMPAGVLSAQELLLRQVGSPPALASRIARAATVEELAEVASLLDGLALGLLREGARASSLGRMVGGLREALAARACQLAEELLGPAPGGYALMLLGRAARREGPALCPMWNAVIHEDAPGAESWCARLGEFLSGALSIMHLSGAPGSPSAADKAWRGTPGQWRERFAAFARHGLPDRGYLDFRPVHGQLRLAETLRPHVAGLAAGQEQAPLPAREDITAHLVDTARFWSMRFGLARIASVERALALTGIHPTAAGLSSALEYATAWQWVGEPLRQGPLAAAMERMCRKAAGRMHDALVALGGP